MAILVELVSHIVFIFPEINRCTQGEVIARLVVHATMEKGAQKVVRLGKDEALRVLEQMMASK